jgi:hypothetical protein
MIIKEEKEIFTAITNHIVSSEIDDKWSSAILKLTVIEDTVDFNLNFVYDDGEQKNVKLKSAFHCGLDVLKLHTLTNSHPNYKKWNKAVFTLQNTSKCHIEYIWNQQIQDELDRIKNE